MEMGPCQEVNLGTAPINSGSCGTPYWPPTKRLQVRVMARRP